MTILVDNEDERQPAEPKAEKKSAAKQLVELALTLYDLGVDTDGKAFGVRKGGHVVRPLTNTRLSVRKELGRLFYRQTGKPPSQNALTEAIAVLEAEAEFAGEPQELFLRAARPNPDEIFIDVGDTDEHIIQVTPAGWTVLDANCDVPVLFRRTNLTAPLPIPEVGGDLEQLWAFVNMPDENDRQVLRGFLVAAHVLVGLPCPILAMLGEQGTAKTSSARRVFSLIDPTSAPVRRPPRDPDSYIHAVHSSRSTIFDNLSSIVHWMSDAMCRTVTGDADVNRTLYSDGDAFVIKMQGVLGFTGIDVGSLNGDLAERAVWGNLGVITAAERKSEGELNAAWNKAYPSMLGGLLDLVVMTLQKLPEVHLEEKPRMADFAEVLAALDLATGSTGLEFYTLSQETVSTAIVETDDFLVALAEAVTGRWEGTGSDLHRLLKMPESADVKYWPKARGIDGALKRRAPDLRKAGWTVDAVAPGPRSKRAKTWALIAPDSDLDNDAIDAAQEARELDDLDIAEWERRVMDDGAIPDCLPDHVDAHRQGRQAGCTNPDCTASPWHPEYTALAKRSWRASNDLTVTLMALRISRPELDGVIAKRDARVKARKESQTATLDCFVGGNGDGRKLRSALEGE